MRGWYLNKTILYFSCPKPHSKKTNEISNGDLFLKLTSAISDRVQNENQSLYNKLSEVIASSADTKPLIDVKPNVENLDSQIELKKNVKIIIEDLGE